MSEHPEYLLDHALTKKIELLKGICNYKRKIKESTDKIDTINKYIYKTCKHNWIRDDACSHDDLSKKYCSKCGLKDYKYMYN